MRANRGVQLGSALFAVGLVLIALDVLPFLWDGDRNRPLWLNIGCLLAPVGFAFAVGAVVRRGRAEQRRAVEVSARRP